MSENRSDNQTFGTLLKTPFEGINRFILADLRDGRLSLAGLPYSAVIVVIFGFIILFAGVALTIFFPLLREQTTLISLQDSNRLLRGSSIPRFIVPIILFMLSVAWAFMLAGTIRAAWWVRAIILFVFYLPSIQVFLFSAFSLARNISPAVIVYLLLAFASLITIPLFMFIRRRRPPRLAFEFCTMFVCTFFIQQLYQTNLLQNTDLPGDVELSLQIDAYLAVFILLVLPFFLQLGMEIAKFIRKVCFWSGEIFLFRFKRNTLAVYSALAVILALQTFAVVRNAVVYFQQNPLSNALFAFAGATSSLVLVWGIWWLIKRFGPAERLTFTGEDALETELDPFGFPAALLLINIGFLSPIFLLVLPLITIPSIWFEQEFAIQRLITIVIDFLIADSLALPTVAAVVSLFWGMWLLRQRKALAGFFMILFGQIFLWANVFRPGQLLENFGWTGDAPVDFWWSMLLLIVTLIWLRRKTLTPQRAVSIIILSLINLIIFRQVDFAEDPIFGLLQFSGTGVVAFGIIWDTVTVGDWANKSTRSLPRESRIFLYLGYVLISLCAIIWAIGQHDHFMINQFTGDGAINGLIRIGRPMLYMLYPLLLTMPKERSSIVVVGVDAAHGKSLENR